MWQSSADKPVLSEGFHMNSNFLGGHLHNRPLLAPPTVARPPPKSPVNDGTCHEIEGEVARLNNVEMHRLVKTYGELIDLCHRTNIDMPEIGFPEIAVIGYQVSNFHFFLFLNTLDNLFWFCQNARVSKLR